MPGTVQNVNKRAKREDWESRPRKAVGGGKEYSLTSLPQATREALTIAHLNELSQQHEVSGTLKELAERNEQLQQAKIQEHQQRKESGAAKFAALNRNDPRRQRAKGREWLVTTVKEIAHKEGIGLQKAQELLANRINSGDLIIPDKFRCAIPRHNGVHHLTPASLQRWRTDLLNKGMWGLISGHGNRKGKTIIDSNEQLRQVVIGTMIEHPHITGKKIRDYIEAAYPELPLPGQRAVERWIGHWKQENAQLWTYMTNPDKWKNVYMAAVGDAHENIVRPNQLWELDSTPGDWLLEDGRHSVVGCIDMYSRRVKLFVSKSSTAAAVKQVLRRSILDWGVPERVRTDNGKDYVSESVVTLLKDLDIEQLICIPFASEEKGTIERFFRTMSHGILDLLEGFIGHNVAERKVIEARKSFAERIMKKGESVEVKLTSTALQQQLDEWVNHIYEMDGHGGLSGKTPREVWRNWTQPLRSISDERALDSLMADIGGIRTITKKGIQYNNHYYTDMEGLIMAHVGEPVQIRIDEQDMGRIAVHIDNQFLCWAINPELSGIELNEFATALKHGQKKNLAAQAKAHKEFTKGLKRDRVRTVIDYRKEQAGNIVDLPRSTVEYSTPALEQAGIAAGSMTTDPQQAQVDEALIAEIEAFNQPVSITESMDDQQKYQHWCRLEQRLQSGKELTEEDQQFHQMFRHSPAWKAQRMLAKEFGLSTLESAQA